MNEPGGIVFVAADVAEALIIFGISAPAVPKARHARQRCCTCDEAVATGSQPIPSSFRGMRSGGSSPGSPLSDIWRQWEQEKRQPGIGQSADRSSGRAQCDQIGV